MSDFSPEQNYTITWDGDVPSLTSKDIQAITSFDISSLSSLVVGDDTITLRDYSSNHTAGYNYGSFGSTMAGNSYSTNSGLTYTNTIAPLTTASISAIGTVDISTLLNRNWTLNSIEWVDGWPDFNRVKNMRDKYPALDKAMDKVVSIYNMVKDDYDNPVPKK
jgi:hypothetical protein